MASGWCNGLQKVEPRQARGCKQPPLHKQGSKVRRGPCWSARTNFRPRLDGPECTVNNEESPSQHAETHLDENLYTDVTDRVKLFAFHS
jgi:hypothetical protein